MWLVARQLLYQKVEPCKGAACVEYQTGMIAYKKAAPNEVIVSG